MDLTHNASHIRAISLRAGVWGGRRSAYSHNCLCACRAPLQYAPRTHAEDGKDKVDIEDAVDHVHDKAEGVHVAEDHVMRLC